MDIFYYINSLNSSKYFTGIMMILLNVGSRFVEIKLSDSMESFVKYNVAKELLIFTMAWMGTRDIIVALVLTASFVILSEFLLNHKSNYCVLSKKYSIPVVEDSCHAILAKKNNKFAGNFGRMGCFSLHPLKNLNAWGDGGYISVKNFKDFKKLSLMRNHGLISRNKTLRFSYNSRLDTIQAVVANHLLKKSAV